MKAIEETLQTRHLEAKENITQICQVLFQEQRISKVTYDMLYKNVCRILDNPYELLYDLENRQMEILETGSNKKYKVSLLKEEIK